MVHLRSAGVVTLAVLVIGAWPAAAQQQKPDTTKAKVDSVKTLPPIEVVGSIRPSAGPTLGSGIPARVTTLTGAQVDALEPRLLSDVLGQQAGISVYDDLGSPYKLNISTRGFYASPVVGLPQGVSVFLDGVRQNEPDAAQVNFDLLPMEHVKRIEILSGSSGLLGRNSLGGAINLVTKRGEGPVEGELELMGGKFGAFSGEGNISGITKGGFDYYVGGGYNREDGWRQLTEANQVNVFVNAGKLEADRGIRLQLMGAKSRAKTAGSLPESVFLVRPDSNLSGNDFEDLNNLQVALLGYRKVGGAGRASFNTYLRRHRAERFNVNQPGDPDVFGTSANTIFGGTADYRWGGLLGTAPLGVRVGVDGSTSRTQVRLFQDNTKFGGGRDQTTEVESPVWDLAGFATADLTLGRVTFSAGARYDYVKAPFFNRLDPTRDTTQIFRRLNPRTGVDVELGNGFALYGSYGQAFRAPSVIELACADPNEPCPLPFALGDDPPLDPVIAKTFEGGVRFNRGRLSFNASAFHTDVLNEIQLFPYDDVNEPENSTIDGFFANIDKTRREGVEASVQVATKQGHSFYANYGWTRATFQVDDVEIFSIREEAGGENEVEIGDRLPLVPAHQLKGGAQFLLPRGGLFAADVRYIGRQFLRGDEANEEAPLDDYVVADARLGWDFGPWGVNFVVNNVFNRKYAVFGTYNINQGNPAGPTLERFLTPGHVRQFRLIVRRSFGG